MYRVCSRCHKIVDYNHKCNTGRLYKKDHIDKLRSTKRWTDKSIEIREASNYLCSVCLDQGIYNYDKVDVHHIEKLQDNQDLFLDNDNLITLCKYHHKQAEKGQLDKEYLINLVNKRDNTPNTSNTPHRLEKKK